jgi:poly(3-hydroxybutyrate) depolymerase
VAAACEFVARAALSHERPAYGIDTAMVESREVAVVEEVVHATPFCSLLHFKKHLAAAQPRVLVVAPMSGHFATLLRGTLRTLLADHDVYLTDWHNKRDVKLSDGCFDLDEFIAHLLAFLRRLGPGTHLLAICQPAVAALAAAAIMAEDGDPALPPSLTLMAGPIDTRINPTKVNALATARTLRWFEATLISRVPWRFAGAGRRVYLGFLQLAGSISMNLERHLKAHHDLFNNRIKGETAKAAALRAFYDEYFAVMDLPAEFFLQTIEAVFQDHLLPRGLLTWRGRRVDPASIRRMTLLTIEGEKDDICAVGQTLAAQELCRGIRPYMKIHHVQTGVGHYGVFNGQRWSNEIYPIVRDVIHVSGCGGALRRRRQIRGRPCDRARPPSAIRGPRLDRGRRLIERRLPREPRYVLKGARASFSISVPT